MRRAIRVGAALIAFSLVGCERNPLDRLLGTDRSGNDVTPPAPSTGTPPPKAPPAAPPTPSTTTPPSPAPALTRFETYRFEGVVRSDGTQYYGTVVPGDRVEGTFQIDFDQPTYFSSGEFTVYEAMANIEGTVGGYRFSGRQNLVYVKPSTDRAFWVDTGFLTLDDTSINFDLVFELLSARFNDDSLENLRSLDQRTYRDVDFWFETDPRSGQGFNAQITTLQRADPPITVASARLVR